MRDRLDIWYDRQGNKISLAQAEPLLGDLDYKVVAKTQFGDVEVSTVWLGLDHNWLGKPPLIFETMTFGGDWEGEVRLRYPTEEAALAGHDQVCALMRDDVSSR